MAKSNRRKSATDPLRIFHHAESFFGAIDQLHKTSDSRRYGFIQAPVIVMSAFASELYFKCLICAETGVAPRGHALFPLFQKLERISQAAINNRWNERLVIRESKIRDLEKSMGRPIPRLLEETLSQSSNSFEEARYLYQEEPGYYSDIGDLPMVVRSAINDLKPSWLPPGYFKPPS